MMFPKLILVLSMVGTTTGFVIPVPVRTTTALNIDKTTADMIDHELYRQHHKKDFEAAWMEKNRGAVLHSMNDNIGLADDDTQTELRQARKNRNLARNHPEQYCADRCVSTGNCDVYEDFFEFSPDEVLEFCNDCVLSNDEEPCDVPVAFYDLNKLKP